MRHANILFLIILSEYNIMYEKRTYISHVYQFKLPIILLSCILNIILLCDTCIYGTRFSSNHSVSQCEKFTRFTTLFWPVNRNLYFRGSCYSLSKTTHNGGKFTQTTELRSVIDLSDFGARSCRSLPCIFREKHKIKAVDIMMARVKRIHILIIEMNE